VVVFAAQRARRGSLQGKMQGYLAAGAQSGWPIDLLEKWAHIYRSDQSVEILNGPASLDGEVVLPGFVLDVRELW